MLLVAPDEAADGVEAEPLRRVEDPQHEVVLLLPDRRVVVQHVVEIPDVRDADAGRVHRRAHALRARPSNGARRSSVLATGSSIASGGTSLSVGCSAADSWM